MSNMDNIINKIQTEANDQIEAINLEGKKRASEVKSKIIGQANEERREIIADANQKADVVYKRIKENVGIRIRDQRLAERQKLIDRVFDLSLKRLNSISDEEFIAQVQRALDQIGADDLTIRVPEKRLEAIKKSNLKVKVDEENFVENGFVLSHEKMDYNFKYEDILNDSRSEIGPELIKFLTK